jgi:hypothetical protein
MGLYMNSHGGRVPGAPRRGEDLSAGRWECLDAERGEPLLPLPTPEDKQPHLTSIYAQSKFDQERMSLICADAYRIPTTALRFFNVYGPRQALSNPYTGVLAIFGSRPLNGNRPVVFEDGRQRRDFVHVRDIARACRLAGLDEQVRFDKRAIWQLAEMEETFDIVLFLGVFYHLRYPLLGLDLAGSKARKLLLFQSLSAPEEAEGVQPADLGLREREQLLRPEWPKLWFIENSFAGDPTNWWIPNAAPCNRKRS